MTTIPLSYNALSVRARWQSSVVAVLGIAGTVAVFVAMLAMARGFQATMVTSGSPNNALVRRAGSTSEMDSSVTLEQLRVIEDAPGVARNGAVPLVSPESSWSRRCRSRRPASTRTCRCAASGSARSTSTTA
jgi:putative ABC transport system permease protein